MAIYHFSAKVISRANGSSAVAAAAYRAAGRLHDQRLGRDHDFTNKAGVIHSEVMQPEGTPERWQDREALWNDVVASCAAVMLMATPAPCATPPTTQWPLAGSAVESHSR